MQNHLNQPPDTFSHPSHLTHSKVPLFSCIQRWQITWGIAALTSNSPNKLYCVWTTLPERSTSPKEQHAKFLSTSRPTGRIVSNQEVCRNNSPTAAVRLNWKQSERGDNYQRTQRIVSNQGRRVVITAWQPQWLNRKQSAITLDGRKAGW